MRLFGKTVSCLAWPVKVLVICGFLVLTTLGNVQAQTLRARISVTSSVTPAKVRVDLEFPGAIDRLSFRNAYAGVLGLAERIERVEALNSNGGSVPIQKLAPGEFQAVETFSRVNYDVNLAEPLQPAHMSHVSWLNRSHGLLLPADLLPQSSRNAGNFSAVRIGFEVPTRWTVASNVNTEGKQEYFTDDPDKAVFLIGPSLHEKSQRIGSKDFSSITSGQWPFSDSDVIKISRKIIEEYSRVTGFKLKRNAVLMLIPFPGEVGPESWSAETRGNAVVLLLGNRASGQKGLARLGVILTHELFHLWIPNSISLRGDYDWFFEGFTLYQALITALRFGLIDFAEYMRTLARVYDAYVSAVDRDKLSLIELSERRWTSSSSLVYHKGMLIAFIYDLQLRLLSGGKAAFANIYPLLFQSVYSALREANEVIISVLGQPNGMSRFSAQYIQTASPINLEILLAPYGITVGRIGFQTQLSIARNINGSQQRLLRSIGYRK